MGEELWEWQERCLTHWFANKGRGMVQAVTGSGKTRLALAAAEQLEKRLNQTLHIKIVVPTSALMQQWNQSLKKFLSASCKENNSFVNLQKELGIRGGGYKSMSNCKYMIYIINSARYELAREILNELKRGEAVLLIADECHHYASGQNQLIFEFLPYVEQCPGSFFSLGLSATLPAGQSQQYLASVLGRKIYDYGMKEASACCTIAPYDIYHISLSFREAEKAEYKELSDRMSSLYGKLLRLYPSLSTHDSKERYELLRHLSGDKNQSIAEAASLYLNLSYKRKSLVCLASARISCVYDLVKRLDSKEKILIFSERISQVNELHRLLQAYYPEKVGRYHSQMGKQANKNILERFRTGDIKILIACKAVDEGVDIPDVSIGIIMSGTATLRQRVQRLGRIIRKNNEKKHPALYYLHITETVEDSCFLPSKAEHRLFELTYNFETRDFFNSAYQSKAELLLKENQSTNKDSEKLQEIKRCLQLGCVRSDWMSSQNVIEEQLKNARFTSDKNYWVCMKKLSQ